MQLESSVKMIVIIIRAFKGPAGNWFFPIFPGNGRIWGFGPPIFWELGPSWIWSLDPQKKRKRHPGPTAQQFQISRKRQRKSELNTLNPDIVGPKKWCQAQSPEYFTMAGCITKLEFLKKTTIPHQGKFRKIEKKKLIFFTIFLVFCSIWNPNKT